MGTFQMASSPSPPQTDYVGFIKQFDPFAMDSNHASAAAAAANDGCAGWRASSTGGNHFMDFYISYGCQF